MKRKLPEYLDHIESLDDVSTEEEFLAFMFREFKKRFGEELHLFKKHVVCESFEDIQDSGEEYVDERELGKTIRRHAKGMFETIHGADRDLTVKEEREWARYVVKHSHAYFTEATWKRYLDRMKKEKFWAYDPSTPWAWDENERILNNN